VTAAAFDRVEQGLGKTVQIISLLSILFETEKTIPFLVVVPNSTIGNWVVRPSILTTW
jgi:SNF2 family DNA or RNA helicase